MVGLGRLIWRLGSGIWLGTTIFFAVVVAPAVFQQIPMPMSGRFITFIFPIYYEMGLWILGAAVVGRVYLAWNQRTPKNWLVAVGAAASWIMLVYAHSLLTRMQQLSPSSGTFHGLHHQSIVVNTLMMVMLAVSIGYDALLG